MINFPQNDKFHKKGMNFTWIAKFNANWCKLQKLNKMTKDTWKWRNYQKWTELLISQYSKDAWLFINHSMSYIYMNKRTCSMIVWWSIHQSIFQQKFIGGIIINAFTSASYHVPWQHELALPPCGQTQHYKYYICKVSLLCES